MRNRWHLWLLCIAIALGAWLRLQRLDLMEFKEDEATLHGMAVAQASGQFQTHGMPSSVGLINPPMAVWMLAVPALFSTDPLFMAGFIAFLGAAAVGMTYMLARLWLPRAPSLCAAWLYAVSPWAIILSRKIWAQDLLPFFAIIYIFCVVKWIRRGGWGWAVGAAVALAALCQIHYSAPTLIPIIVIAFFMRRSRRALAEMAVGAVVFLLICLPFILYVLKGSAAVPGEQVTVGGGLGDYFGNLRSALTWETLLMGSGYLRMFLIEPADKIAGSSFVELAGLGAAFVLAVATVVQCRKKPNLWPLAAWILLPPLLLSLHGINGHYMVISLPAMFIAAGLLIDLLLQYTRERFRSVVVGAAALFLFVVGVFEVVEVLGIYRNVDENGGAFGDYGITYREKLNVARFLLKETSDGSFTLIDSTHWPSSEATYDYLYRMIGGSRTGDDGHGLADPTYCVFLSKYSMNVPKEANSEDTLLGPIMVRKITTTLLLR